MAVMLEGRIASALQVQLQRELAAALTYKQFAFDCALQGWQGFEKFMLQSEKEELGHSCDFGTFLVERGVRVDISTVSLPPILLMQPPDMFESALRLEKLYWTFIEELYSLASGEDDYDTCVFLKKKVEQQHESVAQLTTICAKLGRAVGNDAALQILDKHILEIK